MIEVSGFVDDCTNWYWQATAYSKGTANPRIRVLVDGFCQTRTAARVALKAAKVFVKRHAEELEKELIP